MDAQGGPSGGVNAASAVSSIISGARTQREAMAAAAVERVLSELPLSGATRRNLELGTLTAVDRFIDAIEQPEQDLDVTLFIAHGRAQCAAGRSLTELLAFYRLSGLAMWEFLEELPGSEQLSGKQALALGSRLLRHIDRLSVAALDGFLEAGAELRRRDRARRERLRSLLLSDPPADAAAIAAAADHAGWALPARVRVAVAALPLEADAPQQERAPARVLCGSHQRDRIALIVADGDEAEALLVRAAQAHGAPGPLAIGPTVPALEAARSGRRASLLLDAVAAGTVPAAPVMRSDEHELPLLLAAAPDVFAALIERRLAPVAELPPAKREQALETLAAWLADPHRPQAIADRLGMHVQSVRYRLKGLRELFGDALDDPDARFELSVALRATGGR